MTDDGYVVLRDVEVMRLGFHEITYRIDGRQLVLPYSLVQPGSVVVLGGRGSLIVAKSVLEGLLGTSS